MELLLIDLSSIIHRIYHVSAGEPDPDHTAQATVAQVHRLAGGRPHVAICCDAGKSFRAELDSTYKANRPERDEILSHQIALAAETLAQDGFPVWRVPGFEADDLIATATEIAMRDTEATVLIATGDKDLLQLVNDRTTVKSINTGDVIDAEAVRAKYGVEPRQFGDYLCLIGDTADNVRGAQGIGPVKARELLKAHGSLDTLFALMHQQPPASLGLKPAVFASLGEFENRYPTVRRLIALRTDAPIPYEEIMTERQAPAMATEAEAVSADINLETANAVGVVTPEPAPAPPAPTVAIARREPPVVDALPVEWERQLEPRSIDQARQLATDMHNSRLFSSYGSPQAVLSTVLAGRELGLQAMASLRAFHIVEGRPTLSSDFIRALVMDSGKAKYFRCTQRTPEAATFETQRGDDPPIALTITIDEARKAWGKTDEAWAKSAWGKTPSDMLVARASAKLARLVYPDVTFGLYAHEEMSE